MHHHLKIVNLNKLKNVLEKIPYCMDPITERERGDRAWETGMTDVIQPVVSASQHEKVLGFLNKAKAAGIEIYTGGGIPDPTVVENSGGYFIQPTILAFGYFSLNRSTPYLSKFLSSNPVFSHE